MVRRRRWRWVVVGSTSLLLVLPVGASGAGVASRAGRAARAASVPMSSSSSCGPAWSVVPTVDPASAPGDADQLADVTAPAPDDAWAVGSFERFAGGRGFRTLAEHWNGQRWARVPTPNGPLHDSFLSAVTAASSSDAWAVGTSATTSGQYVTLTEHWDGHGWSVDQGAETQGTLFDVDTVSASDVWAVGSVVEHWDGTRWTILRIPGNDFFAGVAAAGPDDVWFTGYRIVEPNGPDVTLAAHWDGASLTVVDTPSPLQGLQDDENVLNAAAVAGGGVWAVGDVGNRDSAHLRVLAEHWNGTAWRLSRIQVPAAGPDSVLNGVAALRPDSVWAVGTAGSDGSPSNRALIERWDGRSWAQVAGAGDGVLLRVSSDGSKAGLWTVGYRDGGGYQATLAERACSP